MTEDINGNLVCDNCCKSLLETDTIITSKLYPKCNFCSLECFHEYQICDGGDDRCESLDKE